MKKILFFALLILGVASISWAKSPQSIKVTLGQSKMADRGKVSVRFISVVEDSRCPMNARCVWAGNAKIKVAVSVGRRRAETVELNSTMQPQTVTVQGYRLTLQDLNPQKGQPANWPKGPIKATVSVERV